MASYRSSLLCTRDVSKTMTDTQETEPRPAFSNTSAFGSTEPPELTDYRPVSKLAITAMVVGLLSVLANFKNVMLVVPIAGIVLSIVALRQIANSDPKFLGRKAALIGLAASIIFGSYAITRSQVEHLVVSKQAAQVAKGWIKIVRSGNLPQAAEWMKHPTSRRGPGTNLSEFYATDEDANTFLKNMSTDGSIRRLQLIENESDIKFRGLVDSFKDNQIEMYDFLFEIPPDPTSDSQRLLLRVRRTSNKGRVLWVMADAGIDE